MVDPPGAIRLFIGGLPAAVTSQQLVGRFTSFGTVSDVVLAPSKLQSDTPGCRGFAYVTFSPKDDGSLQRCLSLYNGCKWLGGILRVERAREHYLSKLQKEWQTPPEDISATAEDVPDSAEAMRIPTPASGFVKRKLMTVQANKVKHIFAPFKGQQLSTLSWGPLPDPPRVLKRKAAEQAAIEYSNKRSALPPPPLRPSESDSHTQFAQPSNQATETTEADPQQQQENHSQTPAGEQTLPSGQNMQKPSDASELQEDTLQAVSSSSDAGVIDFMSDDAGDADTAQGPTAGLPNSNGISLSKFDSDDEEAQEATQPNHTSNTAKAMDMSRFGSSDDDGDQAAGTAGAPNTANGVDVSLFDSDDEATDIAGVPSTAAGVDMSRFDSDDDSAAEAAGSPAAEPTATDAAATAGATALDLSRFDSDDNEGNIAAADTTNAAAPKAGLPMLGPVESSTTSEVDNSSPSTDGSQGSGPDKQTPAPASISTLHTAAEQAAGTQPKSTAHRPAPSAAQPSSALRHDPAQPQQSSADSEASESDSSADDAEMSEAESSGHESAAAQSESLLDSTQSPVPKALSSQPAEQSTADINALPSSAQQAAAQHDTAHSNTVLSEPSSEQSSEDEGEGGESEAESQDAISEADFPDQKQSVDNQVQHEGGEDDAEMSDASDAASHSSTSGAEDSGSEGQHAAEHVVELVVQEPNSGLLAEPQAAADPPQGHQEAAPLYPDLMFLKVGASFWQQHDALSHKEWQAQRQALQTDYRAKRRAATKHLQRNRKAARH